jgi:hypothetical protein
MFYKLVNVLVNVLYFKKKEKQENLINKCIHEQFFCSHTSINNNE